ncbi:MAG: TonB-dependent receptor [Acidobacteria bacterium]|nr:TonB-dependent receptor [Acidobacteriota bacterium]
MLALSRGFRLVILILLASGSLRAQISDARLEGTVRDETQAVLPGATVTAKNSETGQTRTATTDSRGRYLFANLPPAPHDLEVSLTGFKTTIRHGIVLTVGAQLALDLTMTVGSVTEQVTVTSEAPLVETQSGTVAGVVEERVIRELPLNGRSFADLVQLEPGVVRTRAGNKATLSGTGEKMSLGGARPHQMSFLLDGADMMSRNNTNPAGASGFMLGVDSIQEFRVSTSGFSAEFGRNSGGVVSAVTKSGTNNLHGTVYGFLRNDNLDARDFFDRKTASNPKGEPEFKRSQFGSAVGGPMIHNKTFFFANYEGVRARRGTTTVDNVPTAAARLGNLGTRTVTVAESIKPYLALYPLPNGDDLGGGIGRYFWAGSQNTDQDDVVARIDHQLTDNQTLMFRMFYDNASVIAPSSLGLIQMFNKSRIQNYVLNHKQIVSSTLVNDFRITFLRDASEATDSTAEGMERLEFVPGRGFGHFTPGVIASISTNSSGPQYWRQNLFEVINDVAMAKGAHAIKFGGIAKRLRYNSINVGRLRGEYIFNSLEEVLTANAARFEAGHVTEGTRGMRQSLFGFYFQDDYRPTPRLSLNLGVRYEFVTGVSEANGRVSQLRNQLDPTVTVGDPWFLNPSKKNIVPRLGFAYDLTGDGKTSVRGGFGVYPDQLLALYWRDSSQRMLPYTQRFFVQRPANGTIRFPDAIVQFPLTDSPMFDPNQSMEMMNYRPHQPYTMQYNLTMQRQLSSSSSFMIGYLGSQSRNNSRNVQWNTANPTQFINGQKCYSVAGSTVAGVAVPASDCFNGVAAPRRNPNFSSILQREFDTNANYNSLQFSMQQRMRGGLSIEGTYQLSRTMDEISGIAGSSDFQNVTSFSMDPDDRGRDYSRAAFDIRHYMVVNGTYNLPNFGLNGIAGQVLGGWSLSSLFNYSGGEPFSVVNRFDRAGNSTIIFGNQERPNVASGASNNPILENPTADQWFDLKAFELQKPGTLGNLGRNTLQGPGVVTVDLAVRKGFQVREGQKLEFRWEMFNMFNHANFSQPEFRIFSNAAAAIAPGSGSITNTRTSSRQMQLGLKYIF